MCATLLQIDSCLPQTQCARCGYPKCLDYATAIVDKQENINRCAPGGDTTLAYLSKLTGKTAQALDPEVGGFMSRQMAFIEEAACIGCVLCIKVCPVDAIIGANKTMHTIISHECTGCELCIPVCPTDCITMEKATLKSHESPSAWPDYPAQFAALAKQRTQARSNRIQIVGESSTIKQNSPSKQSMQAEIMAALQRKKA